MMRPVLLAVAPTGARRHPADHPAVPVTPAELAATAAACADAGASLFHLHVRDADGRHVLDAGAYREATDAIRRAVGERMIVQATTEAAGRYDRYAQMALVRDLRPEAVSLALRELIPDPASEREAADFLAWVERERIAVQWILDIAADVRRLDALIRRGIVTPSAPFRLFVLGRHAADGIGRPVDLLAFLAADRSPAPPWAVCAFGRDEAACGAVAAALGGHARVGFENNVLLADGRVAINNTALVEQMATALSFVGCRPMTADEARKLLADHATEGHVSR